MKKNVSLILTVISILLVILASCVGGDPEATTTTDISDTAEPSVTTAEPTVTDKDTTVPETEPANTDETTGAVTSEETTIASPTETTEAETEPVNTMGDCGNPNWTSDKKVIGKARLDVVKHEIT